MYEKQTSAHWSVNIFEIIYLEHLIQLSVQKQ